MTALMTATTVEMLWTEHHGEVVRYLRRVCSDPDLADDLAAETFLAASASLDAGKTVTAGWLMTVAKRRLMDHWRSSYRQRDIVRRLASTPQNLAAHDPASNMPGEVTAALAALCRSQRRALILRYIYGYSVQQVADRLGLTYRGAESVLARGRRSIAIALASKG